MNFYSTRVESIWNGERYVTVARDVVPYTGPVALCKKGREQQQQITQQQMGLAQQQADLARQDQATRQKQLDLAMPIISGLQNIGSNGLSTAASARYAADLGNIQRTYDNARRLNMSSLAQRGLAQAPSGAVSSATNSANLAQAADENRAFEGGQMMTREDQLAALNALNGLQTIYNPNQAYMGAEGSLQGAGNTNYQRYNMGSTLGDIGAGIAGATSIATGLKAICWIAEALWGTGDLRTELVRAWLRHWAGQSFTGSVVVGLYRAIGQKVASTIERFNFARAIFSPLFSCALNRAVAWKLGEV